MEKKIKECKCNCSEKKCSSKKESKISGSSTEVNQEKSQDLLAQENLSKDKEIKSAH